jgi:hypothetical protein
MTDLNETQKLIFEVCSEMANFLVEKNRKYGNSAIEPIRIFSKVDTMEQLNIRIDDKLNRIKQGSVDEEDTEKDLMGYLILKRVAKRLMEGEKAKENNL